MTGAGREPVKGVFLEPAARAGDRDAVEAYLASLSDGARPTIRTRLAYVATMLKGGDLFEAPWSKLRYEHVVAIRRALVDRGFAPATVNLTLVALRGVFLAAVNLDLMSAAELLKIRSIKPVAGERVPAGREVDGLEISALMENCGADRSKIGRRDAALFAVLFGCGLRRAEAVALRVVDVDQENGRMLVRGKGRKERTVFLTNGAFEAVRDWLKVRAAQPGVIDAGYLFTRIGKGGSGRGRIAKEEGLAAVAVRKILQGRAESLGLRHMTPHDARRTVVSVMLAKGVDIVTVSKFVGHANPATTARYDRRGEEAKRKAAEAIEIPYVSPVTEQ